MAERMSGVDAAWLHMDRRENTADVVAMMTFEDRVAPSTVRRMVEEKLLSHPRFRQRIVPEGTLGLAAWEEDPAFALPHHFARRTLSRGGTRSLQAFTSQVATEPLDPAHNLLHCSNAGIYPAFILNREGMLLRELRTDGTALGVFSKLNLRLSEPVCMEPGDTAIILTDGIPEATNLDGEEFGKERALAAIRRHLSEPAEKIIEKVHAEVKEFAGSAVQTDDQTIVVCKRTS